jgi:hypothetical protein
MQARDHGPRGDMPISEFTAPGTLIAYRPVKARTESPLPALKRGGVYVLDRIVEVVVGDVEKPFGCSVTETADDHKTLHGGPYGQCYHWFYPIDDFEIAVLPKTWTDMFAEEPPPDMVAEIVEEVAADSGTMVPV